MSAPRRRGRGARRNGGFALADFMAGSLILAGAVASWVAITRGQLDCVGQADLRGRARDGAVRQLDDARLEGIAGLGTACLATKPSDDVFGFHFVRHFSVSSLMQPRTVPAGTLEMRRLPTKNAAVDPVVYELRATVRWRGSEHGEDSFEVSTALAEDRR